MTALLVTAAIASGSTAYCLQGTMADGTWVRSGSVAHNGYPLGTDLQPVHVGCQPRVVEHLVGADHRRQQERRALWDAWML